MNPLIKGSTITALLVGLGLFDGCASISREDCMRGAWQNLGLEDGKSGATSDTLGRYHKDCAKYGVQINDAEYQEGRKKGLETYCRLPNAIDTGLQGKQYSRGVCPVEIDATFYQYNDAAYQVYDLKNKIRTLDNSIESKNSDISQNINKLNNNNSYDIQKKNTELNNDLIRLRNDRSRAQDELNDRESDLSRYRSEIRY